MTDSPVYAVTCECGYFMWMLTDAGLQCVFCKECIGLDDLKELVGTKPERRFDYEANVH